MLTNIIYQFPNNIVENIMEGNKKLEILINELYFKIKTPLDKYHFNLESKIEMFNCDAM